MEGMESMEADAGFAWPWLREPPFHANPLISGAVLAGP